MSDMTSWSQALCRARNKKVISGKKHVNNIGPCAVGMVYQISLSGNRVYIGQIGRCLQDGLREHSASLNASPSGNVMVHVSRCECKPSFDNVQILGRSKDKLTHEILEAFCIFNSEIDMRISRPSVNLLERELGLMMSRLTWLVVFFLLSHLFSSAYPAFPTPFFSLNIQLTVCIHDVFVYPSVLCFVQFLPIHNTQEAKY